MTSVAGVPSAESSKDLPLILRWSESDSPLPKLSIQGGSGSTPQYQWSYHVPPSRWPTGPENEPFDFTEAIRHLSHDVTLRCDELRHVNVSRILFSVSQARSAEEQGTLARITPLRFDEGNLQQTNDGTTYQIQRYYLDDHEYLYVMTFSLPRFLNLDFEEKLITLFHELYHIGLKCDGALREYPGRNSLHAPNPKAYDQLMTELARDYLNQQPDEKLYTFMRLNFAQLENRHQRVVGIVVPRPKVIPQQKG